MKKLALLFALALVLLRCGSDNEKAFSYLNPDNIHSTFIRIPIGEDTVFTVESGAKLIITKESFVTLPGTTSFVFELKEAYYPVEMVLGGLSTVTSDGQLLQTGGMFFFGTDNTKVTINPSSPPKFEYPPDIQAGAEMRLFSAQKSEAGEILWQNPQGEVSSPVPDTSTTDGTTTIYPPQHESGASLKIPPQVSSRFDIPNFGWINCDRFMNDPASTMRNFVVKITNINGPFRQVGVRMICEKPQFIFPVYSLKFSLQLPEIQQLSFLVTCEAGGKWYIGKADLQQVQTENTVPITMERLPKGEEVSWIEYAFWGGL